MLLQAQQWNTEQGQERDARTPRARVLIYGTADRYWRYVLDLVENEASSLDNSIKEKNGTASPELAEVFTSKQKPSTKSLQNSSNC